MKRLSLVLLIITTLSVAHGPSSATIYLQQNDLVIRVQHDITQRFFIFKNDDPTMHYVSSISLYLKGLNGLNRPRSGNKIAYQTFQRQTNQQYQEAHIPARFLDHPLTTGDTVILRASCSLRGALEQHIKIK